MGFVPHTPAVSSGHAGVLPGGHELAKAHTLLPSPVALGTQGSAGQPADLGTHGPVEPHAAVPTQGLTRPHAGLGTQGEKGPHSSQPATEDDWDDLPSPPRYTVTTGDTCIPWNGGHQPSVYEQAKAYMLQQEAQRQTQAQFSMGAHEAEPHTQRPQQKAGSDRQHRPAPAAANHGNNMYGSPASVHHGNMAEARVHHGNTHPSTAGPSGHNTAAAMDFRMSGAAASGNMRAQLAHGMAGLGHAADAMPGVQNVHTMSTQHGMPQGKDTSLGRSITYR